MGPELGPHKIPLPKEAPTSKDQRDRGVRGVRHLSNWTLAALVVGVGATSAALARSTQPATSTSGIVSSTAGASAPTTAGAAQPGSPTLHAPVTMTTPSGVVIQSPTTASVAGTGSTPAGGGRRVITRGDT